MTRFEIHRRALRAAAAVSLTLGLAACASNVIIETDADDDEPGATASSGGGAGSGTVASTASAGGGNACLAPHAQCDPTADTCCAGTRCIEYSVYDWPRCRTPKPAGTSCWNPLECASKTCDQGACAE